MTTWTDSKPDAFAENQAVCEQFPASNSAPNSISEWELSLLTESACFGKLNVTARIQLECMLRTVASELSKLMGRAVDLSMRTPSGEIGDCPYSMLIRHPSLSGDALLGLDQDTCRLLVDTALTDAVGFRGYGPLTQIERGVLDFIVMGCLDQIARENVAGRLPLIQGFLDAKDLKGYTTLVPKESESCQDSMQRGDMVQIDLNLRLAGQQGNAVLLLPPWRPPSLSSVDHSQEIPDLMSANPEVQREFDLSRRVNLHVALPPLELAKAAWETIGVGDVILLGTTDLTNLTSDCAVVTDSGWRLSDAAVIHDQASLLTVRTGEWQIGAMESLHVRNSTDSVVLQPLLGECQVRLDQLKSWRNGQSLDFNRTDNDVCFHFNGQLVLRGHLIRVEGQFAAQVSEMTIVEDVS